MKKILFVFLLTGIIFTTKVQAQDNLFAIQYSMGFAAGDLGDFNSSASFRGVSLDYSYMMQTNLGIGISSGYNLFFDRMDYATYTRGTESISGVQYRYTHLVPVLGTVDYFLKPDTKFNPFVGLGIGTVYANRDVDMGLYRWRTEEWQFALRPQIGVLFNNYGREFILSLKYLHGFDSNTLDGQQYLTLNVGVAF